MSGGERGPGPWWGRMPLARAQLPDPLPRLPLQVGDDGHTASITLPGDPPIRVRAGWSAYARHPDGMRYADLAWHCSACGGAGCVHAAFLFASIDGRALPGEADPHRPGPPPRELALVAGDGGAAGAAAPWLAADPDAPPAGDGERLMVRLVVRRSGDGLGLAPVVARAGREDLIEVRALHDLDRLRLRAVGRAETVRYLDRRGLDLAAALGRLDHRGTIHRDGLLPEGAAGAEALALALDSGALAVAPPEPARARGATARVHLDPLVRHPSQPLTWHWAETAGGWRLEPMAGPAGSLIAWATPPLVVDPPRRAAWVAETPLSTPQLRWLRTMPALDPDQALALWPRLAALIPGLPAPPTGDGPAAVGQPELWTWEAPGRFAAPPIPVVLPVMRYASGRVAMGAGGLRLPDGSRRSATAEAAALAELAGAGLVRTAGLELALPAGVPASAPWGWPEGTAPAARSAALRDLGLRGWTLHGAPPAARAVVVPAAIEGDASEDGDGFSLGFALRADGDRIDLAPALAKLVAGGDEAFARLPRTPAGEVLVEIGEGRLAAVDARALADLVRLVLSLHGVEHGRVRAGRAQAAAVLDLDPGLVRGCGRLQEVGARIAAAPAPVPAPAGFVGTLRPYQAVGVGWMRHLAELGLGGVLADDMGLGKTVQVLALLADLHAGGRLDGPALVVAPTSLLATWADGARRFASGLPVAVHHGDGRGDPPADGLVVTTYGVLLRDEARFAGRRFAVAVFDEAQTVRNREARSARACARIDAGARFCLTGTPMENHLGELWAVASLAVPGLLGGERAFARAYQRPIDQGDARSLEQLRHRLRPFLLRRTKDQVAPELPPRTELVRRVELDPGQRALYEAIRISQHGTVQEAIRRKGLAGSRMDVLEALLRLRQCCCDPALVPRRDGAPAAGSAKREELRGLLAELVAEGRRVLLFSSFTSMLDLIAADLDAAGTPWLRLDGGTVDRAAVVERFQAGAAPVFLLSLKAGGVGLTLTAADTVVLYDPWWNPAAEAQAADRAHRIGQDKPVTIIRLVAAGTVEDRILDLQQRKRGLADRLLADHGEATEVDAQDLVDLLGGGPAPA